MGYLAALCEALLQSHVPGHLVLLPSLPHAMAVEGGSVEGLRARGNAVVSISWTPFNRFQSQSSNQNTRIRGSLGQVQRATVLFRAPHPWFSSYDQQSGRKESLIEDLPGFFTLLEDRNSQGLGVGKERRSQSETGSISNQVYNVIIVFPEGEGVLRLMFSSYQRGRGLKYSDNAPYDTPHNTSSSSSTSSGGHTSKDPQPINNSADAKISKERIACARVIPSQSIIPSENITIAANPLKYVTSSDSNSTGKVTQSRQGLGIQIFLFPCKIFLRT